MLSVKTLYATDPETAKRLDTAGLRDRFHLGGLFADGEIRLTYTHYDRMIVGAAVPAGRALTLDAVAETGTETWLARRETGILNIGAPGTVTVGGQSHTLAAGEMLYIGMGAGPVQFDGAGRFYIVSAPAHRTHPTTLIRPADANQIALGSAETANDRTLYQFIHTGGAQSCQLVMGYTRLHGASVWNTMPPHTHDRRMEAYLYFDLAEGARVIHFMGEPQETRHLVMDNETAAISPPWSIHCGAGTGPYTFCWAMAGDNMTFTDMDMVAMENLR